LPDHIQSNGIRCPRQGYTADYFGLLLRLATLAPDIVQAILDGNQPAALTRQRLAKMTNLPFAWAEQRILLGFQPTH
jgi:hypothetical protein